MKEFDMFKSQNVAPIKHEDSAELFVAGTVPKQGRKSTSVVMKLKRLISDFRAFNTDSTKVMLAEQEADIVRNWDEHHAELLETVVQRLQRGASVEKLRSVTEPGILAEALEIHKKTLSF